MMRLPCRTTGLTGQRVRRRPALRVRIGVVGTFIVSLLAGVLPVRIAAQILPDVHFHLLPPFSVPVSDDPTSIGQQAFALADLNHDGIRDLVVVDQLNTTVDVYLGTGDGTFRFFANVAAPDAPTAVAVADVASPFGSLYAGAPDGNPDIVVGSDAGDVWILIGRGDGSFPTSVDISDTVDAVSVIGFALGDFNQDGKTDIAVGDDSDESVEFLCNGGGAFSSCATAVLDTGGAGMIEIVAGDFNGDGKLDVATLNRDSGDVSPIYGNGNGSFNAVSTTIPARGEGDRPSGFAAAKLDPGPTDDLVIANYGAFAQLFGIILRGRVGQFVFSSDSFVMEFTTTSLAVADFDGDGAPDVLAPTQSYAGLTINFGDGTGRFTDPYPVPPPVALSLAPGAPIIAAADLGGDALPDFIVLQADGMSMRVGINDTTSAFLPTATPTGTFAQILCIGDCDGSGAVEISELITGVNIALGNLPANACAAFENGLGRVDIVQLTKAVNSAINGCRQVPSVTPSAGPTSSLTRTFTSTPTAVATPTPQTPTQTLTPTATVARILQIHLPTNDMVYDRFTDLIYASVPSRAGPPIGNSIAAIDPRSGAIGRSVFVGSEPDNLAISDDGQFLYVALDGSNTVRRVALASMTAQIEFGLGVDTFFGGRQAGEIKVLPGDPHAVAVSMRHTAVEPSFAGLAIFDDGVSRPAQVGEFSGTGNLVDRIAFGDSAAALYGINTEDTGFDFYILAVDASGVSIMTDLGNVLGTFGGDIAFDGGLVYGTTGQVFDPAAMRLRGTFAGGGLVAPDSTVGKVFFLTDNFASNAMLRIFDQGTFVPLASIEMQNTQEGSLHSFLRWGDDGLAFANSPAFSGTSPDQVFLIETPLVSMSPAP